MSNSEVVSFGAFARLVLDALEAARISYLIGGAVALAAWGEARTTRDIDLVIDLPFEAMLALSRELEKRDMLVPVDVMVDLMIEQRADLSINAIHMTSGYKASRTRNSPPRGAQAIVQHCKTVRIGNPVCGNCSPCLRR